MIYVISGVFVVVVVVMQKTMAHGSLEHFSKNRDYTGFTKQTSLLLDGLNASHLLKKFKARNISTKELGQLTLEDLKALGEIVT